MTHPPKLNVARPVRLGIAALAGVALLAGAALAIDVDQGPVAVTSSVKRAEPVVIRLDGAATLGRLHATVGADVVAGALIARLDGRHIESELAALRKRVEARRLEIDGLKQEAAALAAGDKTAMRARIASLEAEAVEADRAIIGHSARIALLEGQLERLDVRTPVAGRVLEVADAAPGASLAAKAMLAVVRPSLNRMHIDASLPPNAGVVPTPGQAARIWPSGSLLLAGSQTGKIESVGGEADGQDARAGSGIKVRITLDTAGTPLAETANPPTALTVQIVTGTKTLAEHLFAPLALRPAPDKAYSEGLPR